MSEINNNQNELVLRNNKTLEKPHFKTRARLLCQLGEQLIKSESIALLELVKNSYDADASVCTVEIKQPDNKDSGSIVIEDNGTGMSSEIIKNSWLEVGTDNKAEKKQNGYRTPKFNRITLGEKGIGRFGVHRLGRRIELISKMNEKKECVLRIDWDKVNDSKYIEDVPIILEEREPKEFKDSTGTKIVITKLRNNWVRGTLRDVARSINTLNSPFESKESFSVRFKTDNDWLNGVLTYDDIKDKNLYKFSLKINGNKITDFSYDFLPYRNLSKVESRHISYEDFEPLSKMIRKDDSIIDISKYDIGEILMEGIVFDLDSKVLNIGLSSGIKDLKDYLAVNGGIKVFRDNMRIWDYGESDNDWLDLDAKRVNRPSFKLSNRLIIASVYLNSEQSKDLIEKANREGFVDNDAYKEFRDACSYAIEKLEFYRNQDKEKIRKAYNTKITTEVPVLDSIEEVKELVKSKIEEKIEDKTVIDQLLIKLDRISEDYTRITDSLLKSAGTGLNLIAVLHQIEKIIKNMKSSVKSESIDIDIIEEDVNQLDKLVEGYSLLARNYKPELQELNQLVDQALKNDIFRFKAHKISIINKYSEKKEKYNGICSANYLMNATMNLFDNSIWWLGYAEVNNPKIFVDITDSLEGYSTIVVADNGPGFALSKDELGNPFVTAKPTGAGMGIGLHLTKEIMISLKGKLIFPEPDDFDIPEEFKKGAIVALAFKKEK